MKREKGRWVNKIYISTVFSSSDNVFGVIITGLNQGNDARRSEFFQRVGSNILIS
jgi:hypothetical protein